MSAARDTVGGDRGAGFSPVSSNFAQIALESVAAALVVTDLSGRIRYMNLAAVRMLGCTLEQVRGLAWSDCVRLIDENSREPIQDPVSRCLASAQTTPLGIYTLLLTGNGGEIPVEGSVAPFCWLDDDVFGAVMMLRDVTPSRQVMRQRTHPLSADHAARHRDGA